jgi:beta-glucosidase
MPSPSNWRGKLVTLLVGCRKIAEHILNDRVRAVLQMIERVKHLNIPENAPENTIDTRETAATLRHITSSGIVLLKNDRNILPLYKDKSIAIIGPNAKFAAYSGGGSANLRPYYAVTPFDGISSVVKGVKYALGATAYKKLPVLTSIVKDPHGQPGMQFCVYTELSSIKFRKALATFNISDSDCFLGDYKHPSIATDLFYAELEGTLTPPQDCTYQFSLSVDGTAYLYINGEQLIDNATHQKAGDSFFGSGTIEEIASIPLKADTPYTVLVQFATSPTSTIKKMGATPMGAGDVRVGGCPETDPKTLLDEAVALAKDCSQVVICAGLNSEWESEGYDRSNIDLPPGSDDLINAIVAVNPNVVVVNQSGTPVSMP